jgi:hypothetical protein
MSELTKKELRILKNLSQWRIEVVERYYLIENWLQNGKGFKYHEFYKPPLEKPRYGWEIQIDNLTDNLEREHRKRFKNGDNLAFIEFANIVKIIEQGGESADIPNLFEIKRIHDRTQIEYERLSLAIGHQENSNQQDKAKAGDFQIQTSTHSPSKEALILKPSQVEMLNWYYDEYPQICYVTDYHKYSDKTNRNNASILRKIGFIERPRGKKQGDVITAKGQNYTKEHFS